MFHWWIQESSIMAGSCPTNKDLQRLNIEGFRVIVSLLDESERLPNYDHRAASVMGYIRYNIPVSEGRFPTTSQIGKFMEIIHRHKNEKIIVHCLSGDQRTGAIALSYWISQGFSEKEAQAKLFISRNSFLNMDKAQMASKERKIKKDYKYLANQQNYENNIIREN